MDDLSKRQARIYSKVLRKIQCLPWRVAILTDSTIQSRSSLKSENVQRFSHGQGFVIGHQRTNIILFFNGMIIPLPPIPFLTKKFCKDNKLTYVSEHDQVVRYLNNLNLIEYMGYHKDSEVVVLTDSGYDDKKIQNVILEIRMAFRNSSEKFPRCEVRGGICENTEVPGMGRSCKIF